jgi:hypothetical protein
MRRGRADRQLAHQPGLRLPRRDPAERTGEQQRVMLRGDRAGIGQRTIAALATARVRQGGEPRIDRQTGTRGDEIEPLMRRQGSRLEPGEAG